MKTAIVPFLLLLNVLAAVNAQTKDSVILVKDSITVKLPDVYVTSERPLVKVTDDALSFDVPNLIKAKPVNTAFDIFGEIPGLVKEGDNVSIIGVPTTNIIINGRKSSMSLSQIIELLKSTSASKVKSIELLYSSPPKYGVKGGSINIIMEKKVNEDLSADISLTGKQAFYFSPTGLVNLSYSKKKYSLDLSYSANYNHSRSTEDMNAYPIVKDRPYEILQENTSVGRSMNHTIGASVCWFMDKGREMDISYYAKITDSNSKRYSNTQFVGIENAESNNKLSGPKNLQNIRLNYVHSKNLNAGVDYTYYKDRRDQYMVSDYPDAKQEVEATSRQDVHLANVFVNYERVLGKGWKINAGANAQTSFTDNSSFTYLDKQEDLSATFVQKEKEYTAGLYAGFSKRFGTKLMLSASLSVEYNKAEVDSAGRKWDLWSGVNLYPQLNMSYTINPSNVFQLNFSSDKKYPAYWAMSSNVSYLNVYSEVWGNPYLEPERIYMGRINYILKRKYVFGVFANHHVNYIRQQYYQDPDRLRAYYQSINFDTHNTFGAMAVIPFRIGQFLSSRFVASGFLIQDKGMFVDIPFDRQKLFGQLMLFNTFTLSRKENISLEVNGRYNAPSIQGIYDVDANYNLSAGLIWNPKPNKWSVILRGEDLLNGLRGKTHIDYPGQKSNMTIYSDTRSVSLTLKYTFGKTSRKTKKEVDASRFGQ